MKKQAMIEIELDGYGNTSVAKGTSLHEVKMITQREDDPLSPIVGALYNNRIIGLEYKILRNCRVKFLSTETEEGANIYRRSLSLLLHAAFMDINHQEATLRIEHSLNYGYFYSYVANQPISKKMVDCLETRMKKLVSMDIRFQKVEREIEDALDELEKIAAMDRYFLLKYSDRAKTTLYKIGKCINIAQGPIVPSTGYLKIFSLRYYPPGLILSFPLTEKPRELPSVIEQKKIFQIYSEQREWSKLLDVDSAGKLNRHIIKCKIENIIWVSEGLHEKKIARIADTISKNIKKKRIILLAGPSSSGKTTFAKRLTIHLLANGIDPEVISLDNYYLPRDHLQRNANGDLNFESLYSLDVELVNRHIQSLLKGEKVEVPQYDFKTGQRKSEKRGIRLNKNQIVIFEGIHSMNEKLTSVINKEEKIKIYISALTQLNIDYINRIPTTMIRLIRRIVRDYQFRAYSAKQTIVQWPQVRQGEEKYIFPFQEEADIMFNSSLVYEMSVLKGYVEPLLKDIDDEDDVEATN
jgi:uridine kinase